MKEATAERFWRGLARIPEGKGFGRKKIHQSHSIRPDFLPEYPRYPISKKKSKKIDKRREIELTSVNRLNGPPPNLRSLCPSYPFKEDQVILTGWEEDIANIAKNIIDEQSPKQLYIIRGKLQNLIEHNVSPEFIFSTLVGELKKRLDDHLHPKIDSLYLEYNEESGRRNTDAARKNVHHFMRIEEFTAKFMSFYKPCVKKNSGGLDDCES